MESRVKDMVKTERDDRMAAKQVRIAPKAAPRANASGSAALKAYSERVKSWTGDSAKLKRALGGSDA